MPLFLWNDLEYVPLEYKCEPVESFTPSLRERGPFFEAIGQAAPLDQGAPFR